MDNNLNNPPEWKWFGYWGMVVSKITFTNVPRTTLPLHLQWVTTIGLRRIFRLEDLYLLGASGTFCPPLPTKFQIPNFIYRSLGLNLYVFVHPDAEFVQCVCVLLYITAIHNSKYKIHIKEVGGGRGNSDNNIKLIFYIHPRRYQVILVFRPVFFYNQTSRPFIFVKIILFDWTLWFCNLKYLNPSLALPYPYRQVSSLKLQTTLYSSKSRQYNIAKCRSSLTEISHYLGCRY